MYPIIHSFIIILNYQNQFIRILIYQNQSKKKKKKEENTHVSLVNLPNRVQICLILESRQISTKLEGPKHDNFDNSQIGTRAWWTRVPICLIF